jgi:hypothetical protein
MNRMPREPLVDINEVVWWLWTQDIMLQSDGTAMFATSLWPDRTIQDLVTAEVAYQIKAFRNDLLSYCLWREREVAKRVDQFQKLVKKGSDKPQFLRYCKWQELWSAETDCLSCGFAMQADPETMVIGYTRCSLCQKALAQISYTEVICFCGVEVENYDAVNTPLCAEHWDTKRRL